MEDRANSCPISKGAFASAPARIKSDKGFSVVFLIFFLPVILSLLFGASMLAYCSLLQSQVLSTCREDVLKTQRSAGKTIKQLLRMNAQVKSHYRSLAIAKATLQAALTSGIPPVIAAAKLRVLVVQAEGQALHLSQKFLIAQGNLALSQQMRSTDARVTKDFKSFPQLGTDRLFLKLKTKLLVQELAVEPITVRTPSEYRLKTDFEDQQLQSLHWSYSFIPSESIWLHFFYKQKVSFSDQCGASLKLQEKTYTPFLKEDKWRSNRFL